jgi:3-hydroxybutyryl-CoA dehydrogenase
VIVGVVGAGTMGAGIAQIAALGGLEALLHDPLPEALAAGEERLRAALAKGAERGRWGADEAEAAAARVRACERLEELAPCELVIEAAPESLELKRELFARLAEICGPDAILATNTSSLSVTAIAAGVERPERVVGMHFFNPPALMELVEIVAGEESSEEALAKATEVGRRMGRTPIRAADEMGFIANRVARPFSLEGLRLLGAGIADHEAIDRICRLGGGFRMGPFQLMDLVGIDVNLEVARSFWEQSFHEPRWQPHPIQARMVASGRLGRKSGRGYYDYGSERPDDPRPPMLGGGSGPLRVRGEGSLADGIEALAARAGYEVEVVPPQELGLTLEAEGLRAVLLAEGSLAELDGGGAIGFHALGPLEEGGLIELTAGTYAAEEARRSAQRFFSSLGQHTEWVGDAPGLVLGRIVCQIVNEAAFALGRGVGTAEDIDTAMRLGFNYPRGPLEWGDAIGLDHVLAVLDALRDELGEERYRAAPLLRGMFAEGRLGRRTGEGFFRY